MKKLVLAASVLVLGTAAASAADLAPRYYKAPPPVVSPIYDWSGFYAGINGGWGTSHNCWTRTATAGAPILPVSEGCHDADGGTVGGQIGYRWQASNWVFGLEAQGNWADFRGSNISLLFGGLATNRTKIDAFGLFTGQVGYAWNNVLAYVKGGAAVTDNRYEGLATISGVVTDTAGSNTKWGGTVGAGIEWGFAPNWSAAVEYDHLFMGTDTYNFNVAGLATRTESIKQDADLVTVRVNYRFGGPVVARY
jgi:outer membrane immunogenic protein